jgi:hypothetical protein
LSKQNFCIALTFLLAGLLLSEEAALAEQPRTMPVAASWGSDQSMMHLHADNSGRKLALAAARLPEADTTADVANSRQMAEFTDAVAVTARRVSKEGSKQLAQLTRWFALLLKQQSTTPTITPAAGPLLSNQDASPRTYRGQAMRSVTPKHPLWLLTDGRIKTVTAQ